MVVWVLILSIASAGWGFVRDMDEIPGFAMSTRMDDAIVPNCALNNSVFFENLNDKDSCFWNRTAFDQIRVASHSLKIYIYPEEIPLTGKLAGARCSESAAGMYAIEFTLIDQLRANLSGTITANPLEADFFIVPHKGVCMTHYLKDTQKILLLEAGKLASELYMEPLLRLISTKYGFYNASGGSNHVFITSHDLGKCLFSEQVMDFMSKGIILSNLGKSNTSACFNLERDIVLPQLSKMSYVNGMLSIDRTTFASFVGTVHQDFEYSHGVRQRIKQMSQMYAKNELTFIEGHLQPRDYVSLLQRSLFQLCPGGWAPWSPRLFNALESGSIPVIIADGISVANERFFNWRTFSVKLMNKQAGELIELLKLSALTSAQKQVQIANVAKFFDWKSTDPGASPLRMILMELWCRKVDFAHVGCKMHKQWLIGDQYYY